MAIRVGINGFGRIGRQVTKAVHDGGFSDLFEIVAVNDLADNASLAHMLKYDSTYGRFDAQITSSKDGLTIDGRELRVFAEKDPAQIPWGSVGVDLVVETAGAATLKQSIRATRLGGMIAMIGMVSGASAELNLPLVAMGSLRIHGIAVGNRSHLEQAIAACAANGIEPVVDRVMPLADLGEALRHVESGKQFGKVCIEI